jgi:hypothetical protein
VEITMADKTLEDAFLAEFRDSYDAGEDAERPVNGMSPASDLKR